VTSPGRWTTVELALVFAAAFAVTGSISLGLWGALGVFLARLLRTPAQWRGLNVALALLLVTSIVPIWLEA
jgi:threonine/homoserine/homoserine lactone efflux protein